MNIKTEIKVTPKELEELISLKLGYEVKLEDFNYITKGDYDRGTYSETLTNLTFIKK